MIKNDGGLYDQQFEHDNCGIGAVVNINGTPSHQTVEDALQIGQEVNAKILELDVENKKISLSIKQTTERPAKEAPAAAATEEKEPEEEIPVVQEAMGSTIGDMFNN